MDEHIQIGIYEFPSETYRYYCPDLTCEATEYVHYCFAGVENDEELGVLVNVQGEPTNRWEDGIVGVPEEVIGWIEMDDCAPYCPIHHEETVWITF